MPKLGSCSPAAAFARLGLRIREGRFLQSLSASLLADIENRPTPADKAIAERAAWMGLHLARWDRETAEGKSLPDERQRQHLDFSNAHVALLRELGTEAAVSAPFGPVAPDAMAGATA